MTPPVGDLRERVIFQRRETVADGYGNTEGDWVELGRRAARLRPTRGGEQIIAGRAQGVSLWDLWVRCDSLTRAVTTDDRVADALDPARVFNIRFAEDMDGKRQWILLQLEKGAADG
jgi:head-tail adaptor